MRGFSAFRGRTNRLAAAAAVWVTFGVACNALVGNSDVQLGGSDGGGGGGGTAAGGGGGGGAAGGGGGGGTAGGGGSAAGGGAGTGGGTGGGGGVADGGDAGIVFNSLTSAANWASFDLSTANAGGGYAGGAFDGRYIYLAPNENGLVVQYDTTLPFGTAASYATFDTTTLDALAHGFAGATFDGRYVYFVPETNNTTGDGAAFFGLIVRYDTQGGGFATAGSWTIFDATQVSGDAVGYAGAAYDGHEFIYFAQHEDNASGNDSLELRYDTLADGGFAAATSFATFDTTTAPGGSAPLDTFGALFDGTYVYFAQHDEGSGLMIQYNTTQSFTTATSWSTFNMTLAGDGGTHGYIGAGYDGRYVYFVPNGNITTNGSPPTMGQVLRYDNTQAFSNVSSWVDLDLAASVDVRAQGFAGAAFDGRYLYFVPNNNGSVDGFVERYDTTQPFTTAASWQGLDLVTINPAGAGFFGAIFDGRYVYFVPNRNSVMLQFDARSPAAAPGGFTPSFL